MINKLNDLTRNFRLPILRSAPRVFSNFSLPALAAAFVLTSTFPQALMAQSETLVTNTSELHSAVATAQPGDAVVMANGTWTNANILFEAQGAEGDTITLRAETPGEVILTGNSRLRIAGRYLKVDGLVFRDGAVGNRDHVIQFRRDSQRWAYHSRLTNTAIIDYSPEDKLIESKWISMYGTHNRVDHTFLEGKTNEGATLVVWMHSEPNYHRIDNNHFGHRPELGMNGGETIRIGTSDWSLHDSFTLVENNLFERCDGEIEVISNKSGDNIYRYNTFLESQGTLTLRHGDRATVEGNFFIGNNRPRSGGVRVIGEDHVIFNNYFHGLAGTGGRSAMSVENGVPDSPLNRYFQVKRPVIAFNTFYGNRADFEIGTGRSTERSLAPEDVTIANNLVFTRSAPIIRYSDQPINITYEGNIMYGAMLGIPQPDGVEMEDPEFSLADDGLFRPSETSPARGAAVGDYPFVTDDMDAQPRPENARDVGADQLSEEPKLRRPLTPDDVGPLWMRATSSEREDALLMPAQILLEKNYPNPFRHATTIPFVVSEAGPVSIDVFDLNGRRVSTVVAGDFPAGRHEVLWTVPELASGVYMVRLQTRSHQHAIPVMLAK